ncbi:hypothetical protein [Streptomyces noursei]|uniref:hypothetical protein n=1 Tax=Streptomyces noursei TaxID=1971 RepID=UPI001675CFD9|nr:hypothetical protein [Streptomyces noursei]MCZ1016277.1 hypothetical protein [Streptomyces noursei]GGX00876.1 hypothetical protein GCM10010341_23330 [Streptomyces noursei]
MSDITKTTAGIPGAAPASPLPPRPRPSEPAAREAYAFCCMGCGHGWEQAYEIEHQVDAKGVTHAVYFTDGERVPSPLTRPTCLNCGGHVVRIMRSGQVSMVSDAIANMHRRPHHRKNSHQGADGDPAAESGRHHWHLSDLLHPFQHHRK